MPPPESPPSGPAVTRVGTTLRGKYLLERFLGIGGMGAVYAGRHRNGHPVAIKIIHDPLAEQPDLQRKLRREAQLANRVGHRGVVPVIDDDVSEDGHVFLVMPLLDGETLRARWERFSRKLPLGEVVAISHAVLETLAAAHAAKIVHRDVKPENIFLTRQGEVKVLDFGIARFFEASDPTAATRSGTAAGTPAFMAPEQVLGKGRQVDGRTDLWSLGATMFLLLSGQFVHEAEGAIEALVLAATRPARSLRECAPDVPEAICAVVDRALSFEKSARWEAATAMDRALSSAYRSATGEEVPSVPVFDAPAQPASRDVSPLAKSLPDSPEAALPFQETDVFPAAPLRSAPGEVATPTAVPSWPSTLRPLLRANPFRSAASRTARMLFAASILAAAVAGGVLLQRGALRFPGAGWPAGGGGEVGPQVEGAPLPTPARIAVLGFTSAAGGGIEADGAMAAERVAAAIELDGPMVLRPKGAALSASRAEREGDRARADAGWLTPLGNLGVSYVLVGTASGDAARVNLKIEVVDARTGATVASASGQAPEARFAELMDRLDGSVRALLSLPPLDPDGATAVSRVLPRDPDAAREYVRALELLRRDELRGARGKLVAISADRAKSHALTQLLVAEIDHELGQEDESRTYAERALTLVADLPERERLPIEARAELARGNAKVALAKLKALGLPHRSLEDTVRLAEAAYDVGNDEDAATALHELEGAGDAFAHDPHVLQLRAALAWRQNDTESTLRFAREAAALAGERIAVRAQARRFEAHALYWKGGATKEAEAVSDEAIGLLLAIDDPRDAATLYMDRGDAKFNGLDFAGATAQYRTGLELKGVSTSSFANQFLDRITTVEWKLGHYAEAERRFQELLAKPDVSDFARGYAYLFAATGAREQGHLDEATARLAKAREALGNKGPANLMPVLIEQAALERARGRPKASLAIATRVFQSATEEYKAGAANSLGWAYLDDGQTSEAEKMFLLGYREGRRLNTRIDWDDACKGLAKARSAEGKRLCDEGDH